MYTLTPSAKVHVLGNSLGIYLKKKSMYITFLLAYFNGVRFEWASFEQQER